MADPSLSIDTPFDEASLSIWLVEDDRAYRDVLVPLLDGTSGLQCTQVFFAYEEVQQLLVDEATWAAPDVVLMDIGLPGLDGIEGVTHLKTRLPQVPILMLTINDSPEVIFHALRAGASGYLLKDTPLERIVAAVREAHRGGTLMPARVAGKVLDFFKQSSPLRSLEDPADGQQLTKREKEVLQLMSEGYAHKQIAGQLFISPHTVDNHIRNIYQKLHVGSGIQAVAVALKKGLIT